MRLLRPLLLASAMLASLPVAAQELRIGFKAAVTGADPHQNYTPNRNVQLHVYEPLVLQDPFMRLQPGAASAWRNIDPSTWEFTLREGLKFHDGTPVTADDVVFSIRRASAATGLRTFVAQTRNVASVEAKDPRTVIIRTTAPTPLLPVQMAVIAIVSALAAADAGEAEFNGGRAAIGTGPYRWVRYTPGRDVVIERAASHWREPEPWERVTFRFISNDSARVAALLAGDVDVIDNVPPSLFGEVRASDRTQLITTPGLFTLYMYLDHFRDQVVFATGPDGQPLARNPIRDPKVRQAMNLAINRVALAERGMEGAADPIGQFAGPGFIGHDESLAPPRHDPAQARRLLAEAGYPNGFGLTIHCTNDRFPGDSRTCQAVGQMFTAVGIRTIVEPLPAAVFFRRANGNATQDPEFTAFMAIFASSTGVASESMTTILRTRNRATGAGSLNRGRYSSAALDVALDRVDSIFDDAARERAMGDAARIAIEDNAIIPVFSLRASYGLRRGLSIVPRGDQYTYATTIRVAPSR
ncbi:ABC transporter substrate-binding protein [Roseomonas frigidaquae]|uniref:ABC transporter substrate-binding protein n=1 Tax=Falsiroseomonas frigidaquae TaxID=487318 RepID=A0ABX1F2Y0_9PROT|nr:ABC transporter substrate-binding protein [Falsiroseomonas frigidaquae]NKE46678.1 ABC transporter substrate-binding protein [Falsiroseomonas frigidaquae]